MDLRAIGQRLVFARGRLSADDFADVLGVHKNTQGRYERGERPPSSEYLNAASSRADINPIWLLHGEGTISFSEAAGGERERSWQERGVYPSQRPSLAKFILNQDRAAPRYNLDSGPSIKGKVPLISWVQAGVFSSIVDNEHPGQAEEWVDTTVPIHPHTYALRVKGDSMTNPAGDPSFPDGSIIVIEPDAIDTPDKLVGSFVIVKRSADEEATFKQLVKDAGSYYLKPLNPRYPVLELRQDDVFCGVVREKVMRFF